MSDSVARKETKRHATFGTEASDDGSEDRDRWPSRTAFYLAAVGSAVGFGNVWRFPALAKDYGGGAFFIPYLMALFIVGLPVLILEVSLGQYHQTGNVGVFGRFHKRFRGVGMASVACAYMLVVYYSILLAWVTRAFFESWSEEAPWTDQGVTGEQAVGYFMDKIIGMGTLEDDVRPTRIVGPNVGYSVLVWACIWLCLAFGLKWTGRIAYFSMGLPILLLFLFLGKACTLEGASDGIKSYIGEWDMAVLKDQPDVWNTAVSQVFFSLSVTFRTMTAYGSHCPRGESAFTNSIVIGISESIFSFIAGFAVFSAMGHLAFQQGVTVDEVPYAGFSLVFGTWPVVFGSLPGGQHWVRLLFFDLFLLGIDSAFSILEGPLIVILDKAGMENFPKWKMAAIFAFIAFLLSLMYASDAGLIFLDTVDFYINFVLLLVGFFVTLGAGWIYNIEEQVATLGPEIVITYMFTHFGSLIISCGFWWGLESNAVLGGFLALFLSFFAGLAVTGFLLSRKIAQEPEAWTWNAMDLRNELVEVVGYMPWLWAFAMKNLIPHILLILFVNLTQAKNGFGTYEGYVSWPYQTIGILVVCFVGCLILVGLALPNVYESYDKPYRKELLEKEAPLKELGVIDSETGDKKLSSSDGEPEEHTANVIQEAEA